MQKRPNWQSASENDWEAARRREKLIRPLVARGSITHNDVDAAATELGLSRSFMYKLVARYRRRPQTSSLLFAKRGRPEDSRSLDQERERLIQTAIHEFYLRRERPRMADLIKELYRLCDQQNLRAPNYRTIRKRVQALDAKLAVQRRHGSKIASAKYQPVGISPFSALAPLELFQIDHTPVDVIVVDEQDRLPVGRPWLTLIIDVGSRVVAGFCVSLDDPSTLSVARALTHAVTPKDKWLSERGVEIEWPVAGIPKALHLDNAKEFESATFVRGCQEYGIELEYRPPGRPHFGGHVERLIGRMMGAVHMLPGTTFSNVAQKGSYKSERAASLTLAELERWLALEIAGVYHNSIHSSLGRSPIEVWKEAVSQRKAMIRQPSDIEQFFIEFLPGEMRTLQRDGIRLFNIRYWDNVLSPMVGRIKEPMLVKYDPRNLERVYLQDLEGTYWRIPYLNLGLPPISLWELQEARRRLKAKGRRVVDEHAIFEAVGEQREIIEQARKATRRSVRDRRKRERLVRTIPVQNPSITLTGSRRNQAL
jgi:putative transposase